MKIDKVAVNPSGVKILFNEEHHIYTVHGEQFISATTMLGDYFPKFDADKIAYFVARREGKSKEAVLAEWDEKRDVACAFGNKVHMYAEMLLTGGVAPRPDDNREKTAFNLVSKYIEGMLKEYDVVETEKLVFSEKHKISGMIDLVIKHKKTKKITLLDWKTNKKIEKKNGYSKPAFHPLDDYNDANYTKYMLQLNLYKYIMESEGYVDGEIDEMILLHIRPRTTKAYYVPDIQSDIELILEHRAKPDPNIGDVL
jgi:hypothetical protein